MKKSELRQIIKEEIAKLDENILDKIPFVKDVRTNNRTNKEKTNIEYNKKRQIRHNEYVEDIQNYYNKIKNTIQNKFQGSDKIKKLKELDRQIWVTFEDGDIPPNPQFNWDSYKNRTSNLINPYQMNGYIQSLSSVLDK